MDSLSPHTRPRSLIAAAIAAAALLAFPVAGRADVMTVGSDLSKPADTVESHGADTAYWNAQIDGNANGAVMPADGQVTSVRVKGSVLQDPAGRIKPNPMFHFQVLHPAGNGQMKVELSSGAFFMPVGGDPQKISSFQPVNLCVHKGDVVDFNDIGGFESRWGNYPGMPFQVFSGRLHAPTSAVNFYEKDNGTNVGTQWAPQGQNKAEELLMQATLATGADATDVLPGVCPGGYKSHVYEGFKVRTDQTALVRTRDRTMKLSGTCPGPSLGGCHGVVSVDATFGSRRVLLGSGRFDVKPAFSKTIQFKVTSATLKLIQKAKTVAATVTVDSHDSPGSDKRAESNVAQQSKVTKSVVRLKPDKAAKKKKRRKKH